jgi:hypothetical protein
MAKSRGFSDVFLSTSYLQLIYSEKYVYQQRNHFLVRYRYIRSFMDPIACGSAFDLPPGSGSGWNADPEPTTLNNNAASRNLQKLA